MNTQAIESAVKRIRIPVSAAYNFDRLGQVQRSNLERLGCLACCSGWDMRFEAQRRQVVDYSGDVRDSVRTLK